MSDYTPPPNDQVDFELEEHTVPTNDSVDFDVSEGEEVERLVSAYVSRVQTEVNRAGAGARQSTSSVQTITGESTRIGEGSRSVSSSVSPIKADANIALLLNVSSHVNSLNTFTLRVAEANKSTTSFVSSVHTTGTRSGVGARTGTSHLRRVSALSDRSGELTRRISSFIENVVTNAERWGEGERTPNSYVSPIETTGIRAGTGSRVTTSVTNLFAEAKINVTLTRTTHVSPVTSNASSEFQAVFAGVVELQGGPVENAKVIGVNDTLDRVEDIAHTDENGEYKLQFPHGDVAHIAVQYEDGDGNQYNDESKPFVT